MIGLVVKIADLQFKREEKKVKKKEEKIRRTNYSIFLIRQRCLLDPVPVISLNQH